MPRSCPHLDSLGIFGLAFGPKSSFKQKCQVRACDFGSRFQTRARLQLWVAGRLHFDKGLQFCFMSEFTIDYVFQAFVKIKWTLRHWSKWQKMRLNQWKPKSRAKFCELFALKISFFSLSTKLFRVVCRSCMYFYHLSPQQFLLFCLYLRAKVEIKTTYFKVQVHESTRHLSCSAP